MVGDQAGCRLASPLKLITLLSPPNRLVPSILVIRGAKITCFVMCAQGACVDTVVRALPEANAGSRGALLYDFGLRFAALVCLICEFVVRQFAPLIVTRISHPNSLP